jgi:hypothetical protein
MIIYTIRVAKVAILILTDNSYALFFLGLNQKMLHFAAVSHRFSGSTAWLRACRWRQA